MGLKAGIVGLPNVGKSTLFNAITNSQVEAANYPFATINPNVGVVELKDERLNKIAQIVHPQRILPTTFEFVDIAGLVAGASKGEGLGNKFLANIREADAIIHVLRCFENNDIVHVHKQVDPIFDLSIINLELIFADLSTIENVISRVERKAKNTTDKDIKEEYELAIKCKEWLTQDKSIRDLQLSDNEHKILRLWNLITSKPIIYVANVAEDDISNLSNNIHYQNLEKHLNITNEKLIVLSAKLEGEIAQLDVSDQQVFMENFGLKHSGLDILTREAFNILNLGTYFTAGIQEVRAWTFKKGMTAPECAGIIHSDFARGFIKSEVISYDDYVAFGGEQGAKTNGKFRLEGKDYIFKDGDIVHFKFNV